MTDNNIDQNSIMFISLVSSLSSQAWIQMGKMKNPATDKIERNLDAASMSIDMLAMLKEKSSGNLSDEENNLLVSTLSDIRMNFVQESGKEPEEDKKDETETEESKDENSMDEEENSEETVKEIDAKD